MMVFVVPARGCLAIGSFELPKYLRFSEHHRIEAGGNGEQVCNRLTAFVDIHIRREFDGFPVFGGGPRLQNQPRHVALAHGKVSTRLQVERISASSSVVSDESFSPEGRNGMAHVSLEQ